MARRKYELEYGQGSFYQRAVDGRWVGVLEAGWTTQGARRRITVSSKDKDTAWDKLRAAMKRLDSEGAVPVNAPTVKAWAEEWLQQVAGTLRTGSLAQHETRVNRWVIPHLGRKRLDRLTPGDVRALHEAMGDRSQATKRGVHSTLVTLLNAAVVEGHDVPRSVLATRKPAAAPPTRDAIPLVDALRLVAVAATRPDASRWVAALLQGMRQGECLGLTWECVDLEARTIDVSWQLTHVAYADRASRSHDLPPGHEMRPLFGTRFLARPKSHAGQRIVPLVPWMHEALVAWREVAPESPYGLVWPGVRGRPRGLQADRDAWAALCDEAEVWKVAATEDAEPVRYVLHEARHTAASLLLSAGVDPEVVRQVMGWSSVAMRRVYQHASPEAVRAALAASAAQLQLDG